jgi:broad specificity phosphatase PhoE
MTELWLIRHGQTDWNVEGRWQGQSDVLLNSAGLAQARLLAGELVGKHFDAIYSSDLQRARQTADILSARLNLSVQIDPRLREIHQGEWEGKLISEVKQRYVQAFSLRVKDPISARAPGGESTLEVANRLRQAADDIAHIYPAGRVVVVSHGLALATLICQANKISLAEVYSHIPENAHPTVITWL